ITLTGTLTKMLWSNPHAWIYVDVKAPDGKVASWAFETGGANALYRRGWKKTDLPVGVVVTIDGFRARDGSMTVNATNIKLPDGRPNLSGVWQVRNSAAADLQDHVARLNMPAGRSVVAGGTIPYQPAAAAKKADNFQHRQTADPFAQCFMPGVPRIMYLDHPFQVFQTPQMIAMTFEWSLVHRMIYTDGSAHPDSLEFWMGDSRGRWEGDTLVVDVA